MMYHWLPPLFCRIFLSGIFFENCCCCPLDGVDVERWSDMDAAGGRYWVLQERYLPVEGLHRFPIGSSVCNKWPTKVREIYSASLTLAQGVQIFFRILDFWFIKKNFLNFLFIKKILALTEIWTRALLISWLWDQRSTTTLRLPAI